MSGAAQPRLADYLAHILDVVWRTLVDDLPALESKIRTLRDALVAGKEP